MADIVYLKGSSLNVPNTILIHNMWNHDLKWGGCEEMTNFKQHRNFFYGDVYNDVHRLSFLKSFIRNIYIKQKMIFCVKTCHAGMQYVHSFYYDQIWDLTNCIDMSCCVNPSYIIIPLTWLTYHIRLSHVFWRYHYGLWHVYRHYQPFTTITCKYQLTLYYHDYQP